jgi:hypothetical protein
MKKFIENFGGKALYQGTTLVGPYGVGKELGFSPCAFGSFVQRVP